MSQGEIDAILRERRLAAMRAEEDQASHSSHRGHGYDPNQPRVPKGHTGGGQWTSTGGAPTIEPPAAQPPYAGLPETMKVAAGPRPGIRLGPNTPIPPDVWEEWRRHATQGIKGLLDEWVRFFKGRAGEGSRVPKDQCDALYDEDGAICRAARSLPCWEQAALRYGNCIAGRPIPPLGFGGR